MTILPDFSFYNAILYIIKGTGLTAALIVGSMLIGLALGLPMAAIQVYGPRWGRFLVGVYVWFFRGIPILVLLFLFYFGIFGLAERILGHVLNQRVNLPPFMATLVTLGLTSGAYQSQIFRGAILSLHLGQYKAALSLGFTKFGALTHVILPQALRVAIPAWSNEYSILLKDSALAYVLGTTEIMARIKHMVWITHLHVPFYVLAGLLYYFLTWVGLQALKRLEEKTRIPGLGIETEAKIAKNDQSA